jgi:hypothetical protein
MTDIEIPEGFTRWDGGSELPTGMVGGDSVHIILRTGLTNYGHAWEFQWYRPESKPFTRNDIIAYRIVP